MIQAYRQDQIRPSLHTHRYVTNAFHDLNFAA